MGNVEIPDWLKDLPMAPVFRPTDTEFADPIAYISKIEKEASTFGICKIIPPLPKPSKKYVLSNLNKSLMRCPELGDELNLSKVGVLSKTASGNIEKYGDIRAVFTTRQQELGNSVKRTKGAVSNQQAGIHKQVWQSGEVYTLEQFEAKSKAFARSLLGTMKDISPLAIETMFWKAASEKPIYVEYANDVPGSGFGEPEGQVQNFRRQRRTRSRNYYMRQKDKDGIDVAQDMHNADSCETKGASPKDNANTLMEISNPTSTSSTMLVEETSAIHMKSSTSGSNELEGTAGWKLANSPWNLQVIARSPGSLTRFMPDDIPGVTSPMVYIGMLFSWFAWHVEDHELHSMNFLHMGAPKTWYSVPGDHAFAFEQVIRSDAYGGSIDHLAALSLLGEKTTILSPDVVVASGIPCCRLVQHPGEFVVTFPRAYHIGFSHGFNCGEAANFATPQWLRFAREAAVRRAAMNYLPMLSHQQLLYLLTMSFMSRVPRSLLPGARSSRRRDRQREEKEILVKKAFVDDMMSENHLLASLLVKDSNYLAVVWNPSLLPSITKELGLAEGSKSDSSSPRENVAQDSLNQTKSSDNLLKELTLYMEAHTDLDIESDDLFFDFQVDSGTLACVACGILGFPFMCVMQPSETACAELLPLDCATSQTYEDCPDAHGLTLSPKDLQVAPKNNFRKGWNTSCRKLRPRIFCLEHGVQVQELLQSKGGANMLVICHSDYQRMKAYSATIAEEINTTFDFKEIPLEGASQEDLNLIELAITDEERDGHGEDWTASLGVNLRYCVKIRKSYPSKQVQHAFALGGLFSSESGSSTVLKAKWQARKSRSKPRLDQPQKHEPRTSLEARKIQQKSLNSDPVEKIQKIIHYTRRKKKSSASVVESAAIPVLTEDYGNEHEISELQTSRNVRSGILPDADAHSPARTSPFVGSFEAQSLNQTPGDMGKDGEFAIRAVSSNSLLQKEYDIATKAEEENGILQEINTTSSTDAETCTGPVIGGGSMCLKDICIRKEMPGIVIHESDEGCSKTEMVMDDLVNEIPVPTTSKSTEVLNSIDYADASDPTILTEECPKGPETSRNISDEEDSYRGSSLDSQIQQGIEDHDGITVSLKDHSQVISRIPDVHDKLSKDAYFNAEGQSAQVQGMEVVTCIDSHREEKGPALASADKCSGAPEGTCTGEYSSNGVTLDDELQRTEQATSSVSSDEKLLHGSVTARNQPASISDQECSHLQPEVRDHRTDDNARPEAVESNQTVREIDKPGKKRKRKSEVETITEGMLLSSGFVRSPCEGLRPRSCSKVFSGEGEEKAERPTKKTKQHLSQKVGVSNKEVKTNYPHRCNLEGCRMTFKTKAELSLHGRNRCHHDGCQKKFSSHKYAVLHQRVHDDDRPFKCPWKGCHMAFKWVWARTEHIRVHSGERPYKCKVEGCGLSFRFISDYSRHRRKTGHYVS